jgi:hypothetical protein
MLKTLKHSYPLSMAVYAPIACDYFQKNQIRQGVKRNNFVFLQRFNGRLAEWLGNGLQNRVRRFESATDLNKKLLDNQGAFFVYTVEQQRPIFQLLNEVEMRRARRSACPLPTTERKTLVYSVHTGSWTLFHRAESAPLLFNGMS